jgi:hypothetical protein
MHGRSARLALLSLAVAACSHAPQRTVEIVQQGTRVDPGPGITAAELKRDLFAFADDSFHGRQTGTADAYRAAAYLARRAQQLGLEPAGDSLYLQRVPLARQVYGRGTHITLTRPGGRSQALRLGIDVTPVLSVGDDVPPPRRSAEGDVIFVGYGPVDDDELEALARFDLEGKVLVAIHGAPPKARPEDAARLESMRVMNQRLANLARLRPAAIVLLMAGAGAEMRYDWRAPALLHPIVLDHADSMPPDSLNPIPLMMFGIARRGSPLLPANWPSDTARQALGRQMSVQLEVERQRFTGYNVAAVVRGSDPRLNMSYLAFGAHYDHIGYVHPRITSGARHAKFDTIANGANDDASGSVALLAIARQMTYLRPRRSVLFVWHVGEEHRLLGSKYFTTHPTVPIDSIVTEFNAEMIGGDSANIIGLVGPRAAPNYLSWRVGMIVDSVNRAAAMPFKVDRRWDDPDDPGGWYRFTDQYSYAKQNIPVILFSTMCEGEYHTVSDEPEKIDYDKLARVARLMLESGLAVADRRSRPTSEVLTQSISNR